VGIPALSAGRNAHTWVGVRLPDDRRTRAAVYAAGGFLGWLLLGALLPRGAPFAILLIGAVLGTVTALMAMGLILVYRTNRIVNFAQGSLGGVGGVLAVQLFLTAGWNYFVAVLLGVAVGVAVGALTEVLVIRRFRNSPRLVLTVATIGLAQILGAFELLIPTWMGSKGLILSGFKTPISLEFQIHPLIFTGNHLLIVLAVPAVIAGLAWFLLRTDAGVAVRAAAENVDRALLLGIPIRRLSTLVWALAAGLSTLTFVLKAPFSGVSPSALAGPTILLPALAAAVIARMESLPMAVVAGIGLGVLEQLVLWNSEAASASDMAFLLVILAALLAQRHRLSRGQDTGMSTWSAIGAVRRIPRELRDLPEVRIGRAAVIALLAVSALVAPHLVAPSTAGLMAFALLWGIVAVSLVVLTGWGGNISLGQFAIVGTGAVFAGNLMQRTGLDFFIVLVAAGAVGALLALLIGLPALRIQGPFLAVTTLGLAVAFDTYLLNPVNFPDLIQQEVTRPVVFQRFDLDSDVTAYYLCLVFLCLALVLAAGVRRARSGRVLVATRDNERAAEAMAVATTRAKLSGFVLAGVLAGVAGGLYVMMLQGTRVGSFQPVRSLEVFSMAVIGGLGSTGGALLGVFALRWVEQLVSATVRLLVTGTGLLLILYALPGGLLQAVLWGRDRLLRLVADRRGIIVPSLVADRREGGPGDAPAPPRARSRRGVAPTEALLSVRGLDVSYGSVQVLFGVDFDVEEGEIVALLGTNGAGKSTLLKGVSGLVAPDRGTVHLAGDEITGQPADRIARVGSSLMPGGRGVFPTLSVAENLRLAGWMLRKDPTASQEARAQVLDLFPVLAERQDQLAGDLSGGEQQMLSLAQAFMTRPKIMMLDELSLGLAPTVVSQLLDVVRRIHATGVTIVVVEQSVNVALELAERAVFMEKGEVRFEGPTRALLERPDILRSVFIAGAAAADLGGAPATGNGNGKSANGNGKSAGARRSAARDVRGLTARQAATRRRGLVDAPVALQCVDVVKRFGGIRAVDGVDLELREGEILGLIGHNGAGKTTLLDCVSGFHDLDGGRVLVGGVDVTDEPAHRRAAAGLGRSFQDARLYPSLTVVEAISVALERHVASRDMLAAALWLPATEESEWDIAWRADDLVELMGLGAFREKLTGELSTGSRRIVDLACVIAQDPPVVLLDEPSAGIAQKETEALGPLLLQVQEHTGCSILVIEHDMPLLSSICDRMVCLELGQVIADGAPAEVLEHPRVVESYLGTDSTAIARSGVRRRAKAGAGASVRAAGRR
jgi:ABC-type branched-subunit amino acid transport system ATPase component/ABC-type branched-subunit amino acid transport system permease subunit